MSQISGPCCDSDIEPDQRCVQLQIYMVFEDF